MKKYIVLLMLAVIAASCQNFVQEPSGTIEDDSAATRAVGSGGQDYYWYQGEKIYLTRNDEFVNIIADDGKLTKSSKSEVAKSILNASKEMAKYVMPFFERGEGIRTSRIA